MSNSTLSKLFEKARLIASIGAAIFITFVLLGFGVMVFAVEYESPTEFTVNYKNNEGRGSFTYSDYFFTQASNVFSPEMAIASLGFSAAGYGLEKTTGNAVNIQSAFNEDVLFSNCEYIGYDDPSDKYSIATAMGHRQVRLNNKNTDIIMIVVRSGGYEKEWYGNLSVKDGTDHDGFEYAATKVVLRLINYMEKYGIYSDNLKIWVTGFSRGGAVANLAAAKIIDATYKDGILGGSDIYAYTFATPLTTKFIGCHAKHYNRIHNVINPYDIVTEFPLAKWGYFRYGQDYYLPSEANTSNFYSLRNTIKSSYNNLAKNKLSSAYIITMPGQLRAVENILDSLYDVAYSQYAYDGYKFFGYSFGDSLEYALGYFFFRDRKYNLSATCRLNTLINALIVVPSVKDAAESFIYGDGPLSILTDAIDALDTATVVSIVANELVELILGGFDESILSNSHIMINHSTPYYMAALTNAPKLYTAKGNIAYRRAGGFCPIDMYVYDSSGKLVASVVDNEIVSSELYVEVIDDNKYIYIPNDDDYDIKIVATDDGEMTYSVSEFAADGTELRRIDINDIQISNQQEFYGEINAVDDLIVSGSDVSGSDVSGSDVSGSDVSGSDVSGSDVSGSDVSGSDVSGSDVSGSDVSGSDVSGSDTDDYTLPDPDDYSLITDGSPINPDTIYNEEDFNNVPITLNSDEGGIAAGPDHATTNDYVTVQAIPHYGYTFDGWYDDQGVLQSDIPQVFTFRADSAVNLTAKFNPIPAESLEFSESMPDVIAVGENIPVSTVMTPAENCEALTITLSSSDSIVATVFQDGTISGISPGTVELTASTDSFTVKKTIHVGTPFPVNLSFSGTSDSDVGASVTLSSEGENALTINKTFTHDGKSGGIGELIVPPGTFSFFAFKPGHTSYLNKTFVVGTETLPSPIMLYAGDINADNSINAKDQAAMTDVFGITSDSDLYTVNADFNEDGRINAKDRADIIANFNRSGTIIE